MCSIGLRSKELYCWYYALRIILKQFEPCDLVCCPTGKTDALETGSRVGRNQTVKRICDRWMQEGTTDRRGRSHPPQCTTSREDRQSVRMAVTDHSVTSRTVAQNI
ncbi:transposable element Tcb1 transposase [Trichonephila clavipes]|nr:transposable element Tcb1 transposase [Trichonephila clavipes]